MASPTLVPPIENFLGCNIISTSELYSPPLVSSVVRVAIALTTCPLAHLPTYLLGGGALLPNFRKISYLILVPPNMSTHRARRRCDNN